MAASFFPLISKCYVPKSKEEELEEDILFQKYRELIPTLPTDHRWPSSTLHLYKGFWIPRWFLEGELPADEHFRCRPGDVFPCSYPKAGTTWLKALTFATVNRKDHPHPLDSLLTANPHVCVPILGDLYAYKMIPDLDILPSPRIFASHDCRIVYICRNPKDTLVSNRHFIERNLRKNTDEPLTIEAFLEPFCEGISSFGPFWDHVLGFWKQSKERHGKILFLKYEDMLRDPRAHLMKLAEFLGCPFSEIEEEEGVAERILKLCSMENLRSLEVNKTGKMEGPEKLPVQFESFFKKGEVGDWMNYLTPEMVEQLDRKISQRLKGSGLTF